MACAAWPALVTYGGTINLNGIFKALLNPWAFVIDGDGTTVAGNFVPDAGRNWAVGPAQPGLRP